MTTGLAWVRRDHSNGAAGELRSHQGGEPAWRAGPDAARVRQGRDHGKLARGIHEEDADVAQVLELERRLFVERIELALCRELLDGGADEALGNLERGLDFNTCRRAGIEDRDRDGGKGGKEIDQPHRDEKLGADWPIVPEFLQH
jgi:hypothetical protein